PHRQCPRARAQSRRSVEAGAREETRRPALALRAKEEEARLGMTLPLHPPYPPMEAKRVEKIPDGRVWQFEPKWDGFRAIVFRDGDDIAIQSKSGQPLARYFP